MPGLVDQLIVELGLDASKFDSESKNVVGKLANLRNKSHAGAKSVELEFKSLIDAFEAMTKKMVAYAASFLTIRRAVGIAQDIINTNRQLGIMAEVTQENIKRISGLGLAFERLGGSREGILNVFRQWTSEIYGMEQFTLDPNSSKMLHFLNALRAPAAGSIVVDWGKDGKFRKPLDILIEAVEKVAKSPADKRTKSALLEKAGFDDESIAVLLRDGANIRKILEEQAKIYEITPEQQQKTDQINKAMRTFGQHVKALGQELLVKLADGFEKVLDISRRLLDFLNTQFNDPKSVLYLPSLQQIKDYFGGGVGGVPGATSGVDADERQRGGKTSGTDSGASQLVFGGRGPGTGGEPFQVPAGSPMSGKPVTVTLKNGVTFRVDERAAPQMEAFYNALIDKGAPITSVGGYGHRPRNPSAHPPGMATDWNQRSYGRMSPKAAQWYRDNEKFVAETARELGLVEGRQFKSPDTGHFSIKKVMTPEELAAARARSGAAQSGGDTWGSNATPVPFKSPIQLRSPNVTNNQQTEINTVHVNTGAEDASGIATAIKQELSRQLKDAAAEMGATP